MYYINRRVHTFSFADGDHAVLAYLTHRVGNQFADLGIVVSRYGGYLLDLVEIVTYNDCVLLDFCHYGGNGFVNTAFEIERVSAGGHVLQTYAYDGLCQNGCGRCTVTCLVTGLRGNLLDKLCTYVLCCILERHFFRYRHTVFCNVRSTVLSVNNDIATLRTECHFHCVSQLVNASLQRLTRLCIIRNYLCHNL